MRSRRASTWLYTCVVESELWPSSSWIVRRSAPPSSRWVANAWRSRCGWGRGAAACSCRAGGRARRGTARRRPRARAADAPRGGSGRASTRPLRRAARRAPCRPCRARARAPARSRRRRGRGRPPRDCAGRRSRRARRARGCAAKRAVGFEACEDAVDLRRASARRAAAGAARREPRVGHARRAEREAQERAHRGELPRDRGRGASRRGLRPGRRGAELRDVVGQPAHVDVVERGPVLVEPVAELLHVDAVRAPRRVAEGGTGQEALYGRVHPSPFAGPPCRLLSREPRVDGEVAPALLSLRPVRGAKSTPSNVKPAFSATRREAAFSGSIRS